MLTVKEWEQIRRAFYIEGKNINEITRETGRAWRTVKKMVESEQPPRYTKRQKQKAHKLGPYQKRIRQLLAQNKTLPRKQRWTSPTILQEIQKDGYTGAASTVRHFVAQVRKEQKAAVRQKTQVFLPLEFDPGTDAQVDWGEGAVIMNGDQVTVQLFLMKLSFSRRTFIMAFPSQKQESFWLGHVKAFEFFGGVPQRISYDTMVNTIIYFGQAKRLPPISLTRCLTTIFHGIGVARILRRLCAALMTDGHGPQTHWIVKIETRQSVGGKRFLARSISLPKSKNLLLVKLKQGGRAIRP